MEGLNIGTNLTHVCHVGLRVVHGDGLVDVNCRDSLYNLVMAGFSDISI